jgi:hypothetical protein
MTARRKPGERRSSGKSNNNLNLLPSSAPFRTIPRMLHDLGLQPFEGRQHSGIVDARNEARVVQEIARDNTSFVILENRTISPNEEPRWDWMVGDGKVSSDGRGRRIK